MPRTVRHLPFHVALIKKALRRNLTRANLLILDMEFIAWASTTSYKITWATLEINLRLKYYRGQVNILHSC